jgi:hypothetical protein
VEFDIAISDRTVIAAFKRHVGIDYSGAQTPTASLKGLRIYMAEGGARPFEVLPPPSPRKYWTRKGIAEWLVARLTEHVPTLVGIDHAFSFPIRYFETYGLLLEWQAFLDDFHRHWPTDEDHTKVDFIRRGITGNGAARTGNARWRRLTEERAGGAKSVFHFDVQGSVAKSTHAGIPWLRFIRQCLGDRVHFWPFDGWDIPAGRSVVTEVYPALWSRGFANEGRTGDQHDAFSIAAWLARADRNGTLGGFFKPGLSPAERVVAQVEGWISNLSVIQIDYKERFWTRWPACVEAIQSLYQRTGFTLPDHRYELVRDRLESLQINASTNEIEKALRRLWDFDERFCGEVLPFTADDYAWAVYSLVYLGSDETIIKDILAIFPPLLGPFIRDTLGNDFRAKVGATFMGDVGHYLWDVQGLVEPEDHALFDWHGNRNQLSAEQIEQYLRAAELSPLTEPDFRPRKLLLHFTNLQDRFSSDAEYLRDLKAFYREKGYAL